MTLKFNTKIQNLLIGRGILASGISSSSAITIYSGVQPTAALVQANWSSYNSTNSSFLCHFTGVVWNQPLNGVIASILTFPSATAASNTGTGTWCILWTSNLLVSAMGTGTLPNTSFIVGPVTDLTGLGIVRFSPDAEFTATVSKSIADGLITASST